MRDKEAGVPVRGAGGAVARDGAGPSLIALLHEARNIDDPVAADAAVGALVERLYPICERFLRRRLRGFRDAPDVAADATQESMLRIAAALDDCRATSDRELVAWALVTARRTVIDMYRSPTSGLAARSLASELHDEADCLGEGADDVEGQATPRNTLLALAMRAYDALTRETAELLWWRLIRDAEWSEVAEEMSTTSAGAKRRFQRAQGALRRSLTHLIADLPPAEREPVEELLAVYGATEAPRPRVGPTAVEDAA